MYEEDDGTNAALLVTFGGWEELWGGWLPIAVESHRSGKVGRAKCATVLQRSGGRGESPGK